MISTLTYLAVLVVGIAIGFTIAAVTETRVEHKLDKKFWAMQDNLRDVLGK